LHDDVQLAVGELPDHLRYSRGANTHDSSAFRINYFQRYGEYVVLVKLLFDSACVPDELLPAVSVAINKVASPARRNLRPAPETKWRHCNKRCRVRTVLRGTSHARTPNYVNCLPADTRRKLAMLLAERQSLVMREQATESLIAFTEYTFPKYRTAAFHRTIAEQLERVERGEVDRLMLLLPPRHGKSELASKRYPAWLLGRNPGRQFISVSATAELASDFGRDVRNIIGSPEYRTLFDTRLAEDSPGRRW
jgi:hypothetical protein